MKHFYDFFKPILTLLYYIPQVTRLRGSFYDGQECDMCTDMKEVERYTFLKWNPRVRLQRLMIG